MSKEAEEGWNLQLAALTPPVSSNRSQHNFFFFLTPVITDFFEMWASYPRRGKTYPDQIFNFTLGMLNSPVHGNLSGISYKTDFIVCVSILSEEDADWDLPNVTVLNHSRGPQAGSLSSPQASWNCRFLGQ